MPTKIEKDHITGTDTTGHEWDGVKELNTPLPSWWVYTFYATILIAVIYMVLFPAIPFLRSHTYGLLNYTERDVVAKDLAAGQAKQSKYLDRIQAASLDDIKKNPELAAFAVAGGRSRFAENCAPCHQSGGAGAKGYPALVDDDWIWGGTLADIQQTINYGIRNADDRSRQSLMPRFGADNVLNAAQINDTAEFVLSLSGKATDQAAAGRGAAVFAENCVACHGEKGLGNVEVGAPNLSDAIWLYGGDKASVVQSIANARAGSMPAWAGRLDAATIKMLTIYVHSLGGGR